VVFVEGGWSITDVVGLGVSLEEVGRGECTRCGRFGVGVALGLLRRDGVECNRCIVGLGIGLF